MRDFYTRIPPKILYSNKVESSFRSNLETSQSFQNDKKMSFGKVRNDRKSQMNSLKRTKVDRNASSDKINDTKSKIRNQ